MEFLPELLKFADGTAVAPETFEKRREEIIAVLAENAYGKFPPSPKAVHGEKSYPKNSRTCSGHAVASDIKISFDTPKGEFSFPVHYFEPVTEGKKPLIVFINFRPDRYDMYYSPEEIIDNGFALASFYYGDITEDNSDFTDGLAGMFDRPTDGTGYGKITLWAYALSRVIDCFSMFENIDENNIAVIGHSRLGKTALWCAANDTRVKYVCSNDSGCMGAAYHRSYHEGGETLEIITKNFPYWFCENLLPFRFDSSLLPFDQHMLIAACAPRYVCVNSATEDAWADQYSEQLSCVGASCAWELLGKDGFKGKTIPAAVGEEFNEGNIAYYMRDGIHFLGRHDWNNFMDFVRSKINEDK